MITNIYKLFIHTIAWFSFTTLTYTLWPNNISVNRILGFFVVLEVIYITLKDYLKRSDTNIILSCLMGTVLSFSFASDFFRNMTDAIYWVTTVLLLWKICDENVAIGLYNELISSKTFICVVVIMENIIVLLGFFISSCYSSSWGGHYYMGFATSPHTFSSGICLMLTFTMVLLKEKEMRLIHLAYFSLGTFAIMQSGARTYIISLLVIYILYYLNYVKSISLKLLFIPLLMIATFYLFQNSAMMEKLMFVQGNHYISANASAQVTSGRTEFWMIDIIEFLDFGWLNKLFGNGFDYVYFVNKSIYGLEIWSHNDVINLLLSTGLFGTSIYICVYYKVIKRIRCMVKGFINQVLIITYFVAVALINGFFGYQHYLYSFVILLLLLSVGFRFENIKENYISGGKNI